MAQAERAEKEEVAEHDAAMAAAAEASATEISALDAETAKLEADAAAVRDLELPEAKIAERLAEAAKEDSAARLATMNRNLRIKEAAMAVGR